VVTSSFKHELSNTMTENLTAHRVLVVDDEGLIRWAARKALLAHGCVVQEAADAKHALQAASEAVPPFDAVLLDLKLPDSDDLSLLKSIRARLPDARIILMTAFGTAETRAEALALGAFRVVRKPFDVKALAAMVVGSDQSGAAETPSS
jgi:DNA-binding NtrC family response regulator